VPGTHREGPSRCGDLPAPAAGAPTATPERGVAVTIEDLAPSRAERAILAGRLVRAGVGAVAISAGRPEWTTFPWPRHPERWWPPVRETGRDLFRDAVATLGAGRRVTAVIDVLAPRYVADNPALAARDACGRPVSSHVSTVELVAGEAGRRLLEMVDHVARTYPVDAVDLTELYYRDEGYGEDDARAYRARTGRADWPRGKDGAVDVLDPSIGAWRSELLEDLVRRAADLVHAHGKQLLVDVRASWSDLGREGEENGQCYRRLLAHADRLVVWDYFALAGRPASETSRLARALNQLAPGRFVLAVGLWGQTEADTLLPEDLAVALDLSAAEGVHDAWMIPAHRAGETHWQVLEQRWR
jgi:hypothetical protein